jgi:hypothetical protein
MAHRTRPIKLAVALVVALAVATLALVACTGAVAPGTQGGASSGAANAASQGSAGGGGGGAAGPVPDPCTLLTADDVTAQFEFEVKQSNEPGSNAGATSPSCSWLPVDFHPTFAGVELNVEPFDDDFYNMTRSTAKNAVDVPGVGDAAYFEGPASPYNLRFRQGDLMFLLSAVAAGPTPTPDEVHQKVVTLAKAVLGRI